MTATRRNQLCALLLLVGSAAARLPVESHITAEYRQSQLLPPKLDTSLRDELGQEGFVAAFGGLRSLIATYWEIKAFEQFYAQPPRWDQVDKNYTLCCQLQPRDVHFWDMHSWMLASNAAEYYATEGGATKDREADLRKFYRDKGLAVALKGIVHNPDSYWLYRQAAFMLSNPHPKLNPNPDHAKAAILFLKASQCSDANIPPAYPARYLYRMYAYELARIPGQEQKAYDELIKLYREGPAKEFPTTITLIKKLEEKLNIPVGLRIPEAAKPRKS